MRRLLVEIVKQTAQGKPFSLTFETPKLGTVHRYQSITVEIVNYSSGAVSAVVALDGRPVTATNQGQRAAAGGDPFDCSASQLVTVTWNPTTVPGIVIGKATAVVDVLEVGAAHSSSGR